MRMEMETVIEVDRSDRVVLPTKIRNRFKASRFDLKREVVLVLLALTISASWLCLASAALPDNNNTEVGNYGVAYLSNNPIVAGIIGGVIGAVLTYIRSLRLLKRRLERENAVRFLTEHYLPILGTLEWVAYARSMCDSDDTYKETVGLSDEETKRIFLEDISKLSQTLEYTMRSGTNVLLYRIDEDIYKYAVALDYLIRDCLYTISQSQNISDDDITEAIDKITPSIVKLHQELSKMGMPTLIKEYQKIMGDKNPILED